MAEAEVEVSPGIVSVTITVRRTCPVTGECVRVSRQKFNLSMADRRLFHADALHCIKVAVECGDEVTIKGNL